MQIVLVISIPIYRERNLIIQQSSQLRTSPPASRLANKFILSFVLTQKKQKVKTLKTFAKNELRFTKTNDMYVSKTGIRLLTCLPAGRRFTLFIFLTQNFLCQFQYSHHFLCVKKQEKA